MRARVLAGLVLGLLCLGLALWGVPMSGLADAFRRMDAWSLLPVALIFLLQQVVRAWRQLLIVRPLAPAATWHRQLAILCMSFFLINTLPARLGEAARPWLLLEKEGVPLGAGFGAVFVERVFDLAAALAMVLGVALWVDMPGGVFTAAGREWDPVMLGRVVATGLLPPLLAMLLGLVFFGEPFLAFARRTEALVERLLPWSWVARLGRLALGFAGNFVTGVRSVRSPGRMLGVAALTAATWGLTGWLYVFLARGFGIADRIGYGEGIGVLCVTMLGIALPAPPGFAGVYEAFVRGALALFGVREGGVALAYALVVHWWIYLVQSATAAWFFATERVDPRSAVRHAREAWSSMEEA